MISHESALSVFDLSDILPAGVHVTVPRSASRRRSGIKMHTRRLEPEEITWREGLPVTRAERTITDNLQEEVADEQVSRRSMKGSNVESSLLKACSNRLPGWDETSEDELRVCYGNRLLHEICEWISLSAGVGRVAQVDHLK